MVTPFWRLFCHRSKHKHNVSIVFSRAIVITSPSIRQLQSSINMQCVIQMGRVLTAGCGGWQWRCVNNCGHLLRPITPGTKYPFLESLASICVSCHIIQESRILDLQWVVVALEHCEADAWDHARNRKRNTSFDLLMLVDLQRLHDMPNGHGCGSMWLSRDSHHVRLLTVC